MPKYRTVCLAAHCLILISTKGAKPTFPLAIEWQVNKPCQQAIGSCSIVLRAPLIFLPFVTQQVASNQLHLSSNKKIWKPTSAIYKFIKKKKKLFQAEINQQKAKVDKHTNSRNKYRECYQLVQRNISYNITQSNSHWKVKTSNQIVEV